MEIVAGNLETLVDYLKTHGSVTSAKAMELLNLKASQARHILNAMAGKNILEAKGQNRNRHYVISTKK